MEELLKKLNEFLGKAALETYAGGGPNFDPEKAERGMKELEYGNPENEQYYKDSYGGFFQSWGREVVWHNQKPFWVQIYGGGMELKYHDDTLFTHQTFDFLKNALSAGEKRNSFQPRGPASFKKGDWSYRCQWKGDITRFKGDEEIKYRGKRVFTHQFSGGLFIYREE